MDVTGALVGTGLQVRARATRPGVTWPGKVGEAPGEQSLAGVTGGYVRTLGFPDRTSQVELILATGQTNVNPAATGLLISGVTGTGAASINGNYTMDVALTNGFPSWSNGTAQVRWAFGAYYIVLAGVDQFRGTIMTVGRPDELTESWAIEGAATGMPVVIADPEGAPATAVPAGSGIDFEGLALGDLDLLGLEVRCTAGQVWFRWQTGLLVLSAGQRMVLPLPGGLAAAIFGGAGASLLFYGIEDSECVVMVAGSE